MPPRYIKARPEVQADRGHLAIQRGPIVYCMEGVDQPDRHAKKEPSVAEGSFLFVQNHLCVYDELLHIF
jgi:DUF1680 family protein